MLCGCPCVDAARAQDNDASDSEDESERWRRKPFRFTPAAAIRRAAQLKEAAEDEADRMRELEEAAAQMSGGAKEEVGVGAMLHEKREAKLAISADDGIMKARALRTLHPLRACAANSQHRRERVTLTV